MRGANNLFEKEAGCGGQPSNGSREGGRRGAE